MLQHPGIDPVAFSLGPLRVHWYGLMYLVGFLGGAGLGIYRARRPESGWRSQEVWDLLFYVALGVIIGGRLGYVLLYNLPHYLAHPADLLRIWTGGMSFHGALIGVIVAVWLFARRSGRAFLSVGDFLAPLCPLGLAAGRIGNFVNQELWGRVTELPWGVVFAGAGPLPRHPSQLYEAFLEGVVLFIVVWSYSARPRPLGAVSGLFLLCYGIFRCAVEFVREPDLHIGFLALGWVTMGQLLSVPLIAAGAWLMVRARGSAA